MKIILNPDKQKVIEVRKALEDNDLYCPCQTKKTEDTKCPCKKFREGKHCCCELYITIEE